MVPAKPAKALQVDLLPPSLPQTQENGQVPVTAQMGQRGGLRALLWNSAVASYWMMEMQNGPGMEPGLVKDEILFRKVGETKQAKKGPLP